MKTNLKKIINTSNLLGERISNKTKLLLLFNYISSFASLVISVLCFFVLGIKEVIPFVFLGYPIVNLTNVYIFKQQKNLVLMAMVTSIISLVSTLIITVFSGGIESPFIFVFALIVLAGFISTSKFGSVYIKIVIGLIIAIYLVEITDFKLITNVVPLESRKLFSLVSVLFSVFLLGDVFGKNLLKTHHQLYKSKSEIEQQIKEKEVLLREVHHRVKNNLQTISSLLNIQSRDTDNIMVKNIMKSSQNRILVMSMVHEMLYMHKDLSKIEISSYIEGLSTYLLKSLKPKESDIKLHLEIPKIELGIDTAIPLGLLINETVTNSLKYGFTDSLKGEINISLTKDAQPDTYILTIGDNGVGFPEDLTDNKPKSIGLKLIYNLAKQLKGSVEKIAVSKGTQYVINFTDISPPKKSVS